MGAVKKHTAPSAAIALPPSKLVVCTLAELEEVMERVVARRASANTAAEPEPEYMTTQQVAELLQTSTRNIRYLAARKTLPSVRIGDRELRFRRSDVLEYLGHRGGGDE